MGLELDKEFRMMMAVVVTMHRGLSICSVDARQFANNHHHHGNQGPRLSSCVNGWEYSTHTKGFDHTTT